MMGTDREIADLVRKFIDDMKIHCPEVTCEDRVYQNAPDFVHQLCELSGYYEYDDEE